MHTLEIPLAFFGVKTKYEKPTPPDYSKVLRHPCFEWCDENDILVNIDVVPYEVVREFLEPISGSPSPFELVHEEWVVEVKFLHDSEAVQFKLRWL